MDFRAQKGENMTAIERKVLIFHRRMAQCMWWCLWPTYRLEIGRKAAQVG